MMTIVDIVGDPLLALCSVFCPEYYQSEVKTAQQGEAEMTSKQRKQLFSPLLLVCIAHSYICTVIAVLCTYTLILC